MRIPKPKPTSATIASGSTPRRRPFLGALLSLNLAASSTASAAAAQGGTHDPQKAITAVAAFIAPPRQRRAKFDSNSSSMKRAPSSPAAFASSLKRSFDLSKSKPPSSFPSRPSMTSTTAAATDADAPSRTTPTPPPLANFRSSFSHSWLDQLSSEDPANFERSMAQRGRHPGRPVFNGHYVRVRPTPLKNPTLVLHSPEVLKDLGFRAEEAHSVPFVKYFSGDVDGAFGSLPGMETDVETWATPYALSIMGQRQTRNCPYGTGDGYGDGRAVSVGEVIVPRGDGADGGDGEGGGYPASAGRYELQLKGAGQTPFCRGADGRAVLRSSIREFLASEAMHHLGVSTTRALSLIVSESPKGSTSTRPWYSEKNRAQDPPKADDPRLAQYDAEQRRELLARLAAQAKSDPDRMVEEKCAITTRVAPSFVRIGHLDLFARRVERRRETGAALEETREYRELEEMMWHACYREYYEEAYAPFHGTQDVRGAAMALLDGAMTNIATMVGGWIRVGFVQGNFNADNCLVAGRTMDYGPFGFLDVYHPLSAKWTGSGEHFGFMNQPDAGYANFSVLVESLLPIIGIGDDVDVDEIRAEILTKAKGLFSDEVAEVMRTKMGLVGGSAATATTAENLWGEVELLLRTARGDWTLFWRQLTYVAAAYSPAAERVEVGGDGAAPDHDGMMAVLLGEKHTYPFYAELTKENRAGLRAWIEKWHGALTECYACACARSPDAPAPEETMRRSNPKYTLREWTLVEAYSRADAGKRPGNPFPARGGDYSGVHELFKLCQDPYGEGPAELSAKYYRRAPEAALRAGGTAFMS